MDQLKGPNVQIVLHIREGLGFGFLRSPFLVSGSLNGYLLETDPVVPSHAPVFDAELVWEADKRRFRNLRVQNVPIKMEVYTTSTQGRKDKVGYLLLSLLSAQPCPSNKIFDLKDTWHKLLGVKSEGKCCHPQLLINLSVQDRLSTPTPRNDLQLFHNNEVAYPSEYPTNRLSTTRSLLFTLKEYIMESKKTVNSIDLQPKLMCEEGLIQIGNTSNSKCLFILSFVIGSVENVDLQPYYCYICALFYICQLLPAHTDEANKETSDCFVSYSVFTHHITTDKTATSMVGASRRCAQFNQRTSLRVRSDLPTLVRYFSECPYVVTKLCANDTDLGICSMDIRKLIPTDNINDFVNTFCNEDNTLKIHERCYMLSCDENHQAKDESRKPFIDIEMSLKYIGVEQETNVNKNLQTSITPTNIQPFQKRNPLASGSVSEIIKTVEMKKDQEVDSSDNMSNYKSGSCTHLDQKVRGAAYANVTKGSSRYKQTLPDASVQCKNEIGDMIKHMCDSFALSQERLLSAKSRSSTCDMQVQCDATDFASKTPRDDNCQGVRDSEPVVIEKCTSDCKVIRNEKAEAINKVLSPAEKQDILQKFVDELEDWKEKQQELYKYQLKTKEEYYLDMLSKEWTKKRTELECKLSKGIEQCKNLAEELSRATEDFRLRGFKNNDRERKLLEAKKALEQHYTAKYQDLRDVSQKMEEDMRHQIKLKDMRVEELEATVQHLQKKLDTFKNNLKNSEKEAQNKYSILTEDQTASLIKELRCLEEKLDGAVQSKAFFKEQWAQAVRELHRLKTRDRRHMLANLQRDRGIDDIGLDPIQDEREDFSFGHIGEKKRKHDAYLEELDTTRVLHTHSVDSNDTPPEGIESINLQTARNRVPKDRLNELMAQRSKVLQEDCPDEKLLMQLNNEITNLLLNYGT